MCYDKAGHKALYNKQSTNGVNKALNRCDYTGNTLHFTPGPRRQEV